MKNNLLVFSAATLVFASCQSNETGNSKDVAQDQIYRNYEVIMDETASTAWVSAVFRFAGENGTTLLLSPPSKITANGVDLVVDSLLFGGAYYKSAQSVNCPGNKVEINFTDFKENVLTESYEAGNASLTEIDDTLFLGKDISISFSYSGGENLSNIELAVIDANGQSLSFYSESNTDKFFKIPGTATDTLAQGEMKLQLVSHSRKDLDNHNTLGGKMDFSCNYKPVRVMAVKPQP